jgi:hypothetical protein
MTTQGTGTVTLLRPLRSVILIAAVAICTQPAYATWFPDVRLTKDQHSSETSVNNVRHIVADSSGDVHVVWADDRHGQNEIYYKRFGGSGWSEDERLTNAAGNSLQAGLAIDGSDNLHVVWTDYRDGNGEIYYKRFDGAAWQADQRLTDAAGLSLHPSIAAEPDGKLHVVWYDERGDSQGIYHKYFNGTNWAADEYVTSFVGLYCYPGVAPGQAGVLHLVWEDQRDSDYEIYYKRHNGISWGATRRLTVSPGYSRFPSVVADSSGRVHVFWQDYRDGDYEVYLKTYDGVGWGGDERLTTAAGDAYQPMGALGTGDNMYVVWSDSRHGNWEIYHKSFDGVGWSPDERLTAVFPGDSRHVSLAGDHEGNLHMAWQDDRDGNEEIYWKEYYTGVLDKPELVSIEPATGFTGETAYNLNLSGSGFMFPDSVWLAKVGESRRVGFDVRVESSSTIECRVGLADATLGFWDVILRNPDGQMDTLLSAFCVTPERWGEDTRLTCDSGGSFTSCGFSRSVAADAAGNLSVVWRDNRDGNQEIYHRRRDGTVWGAAERLTYADEPSRYPSVAIDVAGKIHVVWEDIRNETHSEIYYKMFDGVGWTPDTCLTDDSAASERPSLIADNAGILHLAWLDRRDGSGNTYYKRLVGDTWTMDERISDPGAKAQSPCVAVDGSGNVHVAWPDSRIGYGEVFYDTRSGGGTWGTDQQLSDTQLKVCCVSAAAGEDGAVYIVWADNRDRSDTYELYYNRFEEGAWIGEERITFTLTVWTHDPSVVVDNDGLLHVVYRENIWGGDIYHLMYDDGTWHDPMRITYDGAFSYEPSVALDGSGNAHIVWTDQRDGNDEVYYKMWTREHSGGIDDPEIPGRTRFSLKAVPNPLGKQGEIQLSLDSPTEARISVYDTMGRLVWERDLGVLMQGVHSVPLPGRTESGSPIAAGIYFLRLETRHETATAKMVIIN